VDLQGIGRLLAGVGLGPVAAGALLWLAGRLGLGRLPDDIVVRRGTSTFAFPLVTSLLRTVDSDGRAG
jgi:multisubunit Na+/H+ antiporter MnhG subunit